MKKLETYKIGWTLAFAMVGVLLAAGFQNATDKVGTVDLGKVMDDSDMGKQGQVKLNKMNQDRIAVLQFMSENRVLTEDQSKRIRELSLKNDRTKEEQSELDRIKAEVIAANKRSQELSNKASLSVEEHALLDDFARRTQTTEQIGRKYQQDFLAELDQANEQQKAEVLKRARESVQQVAKAQGYNVVFEARVAPYAANDLTPSALTAMNASSPANPVPPSTTPSTTPAKP